MCVSARGWVFVGVLCILLHVDTREGFLCVCCVELLHIMHNILFKFNIITFNFLVSKSMHELVVWEGVRGNQMCSLFWYHFYWVVHWEEGGKYKFPTSKNYSF
jgi:hypothetical protein